MKYCVLQNMCAHFTFYGSSSTTTADTLSLSPKQWVLKLQVSIAIPPKGVIIRSLTRSQKQRDKIK